MTKNKLKLAEPEQKILENKQIRPIWNKRKCTRIVLVFGVSDDGSIGLLIHLESQ